MTKFLFIISLVVLCHQPLVLISQNHQLKFVALTVLVANQVSISYEYAFTKNHSIGIQFSANLLINPLTYYHTVTYQRSGVHLNYRYYFLHKNKAQLFAQLEFGYTNFSYGDISVRSYAKEIGGGPLLGYRKSIGSNGKWFVDFALGFDVIRRDYYKITVDWDIRCETTNHEGHNHVLPDIPEDKTMIKPRGVIEFGFKF